MVAGVRRQEGEGRVGLSDSQRLGQRATAGDKRIGPRHVEDTVTLMNVTRNAFPDWAPLPLHGCTFPPTLDTSVRSQYIRKRSFQCCPSLSCLSLAAFTGII